MKARIVALLLSGALLAGAQGAAATAGGGLRGVAEPDDARDGACSAAQDHVQEQDRARHHVQVLVRARQLADRRTRQAHAAGGEQDPAGHRGDGQPVSLPDRTRGLANL
jgi:hypothetical protein